MEGCPIVRAQAELIGSREAGPAAPGRGRLALVVAAVFFVVALGAYVADLRLHPEHLFITWFDLGVYNDAGQLVRHTPGRLYTWRLFPGIKFTYTPFAALVFSGTSLLRFQILKWAMTVLSLAAVPLVSWLTFGALGWRGARRGAASLAIAAFGLWTEPVQRALHLGQIELVLMLLIVWDLCQPDKRLWKGMGVGVAAGIKLVPLIFIPYLLLAGKVRQAAVATLTFAITVGVGFLALPKVSSGYWLTGYFLRPGNTGSVGALVNQSMLGFLTRTVGTLGAAQPVWLVLAAVIGLVGVTGAALLNRSGRPVQGWVLCALTGVLVSPISWDHHWVWIVPILAVLVDAALRSRGGVRWSLLTAAVLLWGLFGAWPGRFHGKWAYIPEGLLGFFVNAYKVSPGHHPPPLRARPMGLFRHLIAEYLGRIPLQHVWDLHGSQLFSYNIFALCGLVLFAGLLVAAFGAWRAARRARVVSGPTVPASAAEAGPGPQAGGGAEPGSAADASPAGETAPAAPAGTAAPASPAAPPVAAGSPRLPAPAAD